MVSKTEILATFGDSSMAAIITYLEDKKVGVLDVGVKRAGQRVKVMNLACVCESCLGCSRKDVGNPDAFPVFKAAVEAKIEELRAELGGFTLLTAYHAEYPDMYKVHDDVVYGLYVWSNPPYGTSHRDYKE